MRTKILMLSFRLPVPLTEGFKIRAYYLAKILAQAHTIDLVTFHNGAIPPEQEAQLREVFRRVICFPLPPLRARVSALWAFPTPLPLQVFYYRASALQRWVARHHSEYDLIFCVHTRMAQYALDLPTKKVIDLIDASSLLYQGALPYTHGLWHWIYRLESQRLQKYEHYVIRSFDKAFVASPYDATYLQRAVGGIPKGRLIVLPNGVREELLRQHNPCPEEHSLLFLGKMDYAPNVDAVVYFGREVFPHLRAQDPALKFMIVGTSPRRAVRQLAQLSGVIVTGYVEDPFVYVQRAKVVVAPLRFAAGVQNKVLEALALGKAVVATPAAARWLPADEQAALCVASHPQELISVIMDLLHDAAERKHLGERGHQLVCSRYRWGHTGERLLAEIESVLRS